MTIIDAHIVQLIICAIMIWLGQGPIRGFGVTLAIGVLSTMFSVLVTAHLIMELLIDSGTVKKIRMGHLIKAIHVDFVRYGKPAFIGSGLLVILGMAAVFYQGSGIFGVDFSGGDVVTMQYKERLDIGKIREVADAAKVGEINATFESGLGGGNEQLKIETPGRQVPGAPRRAAEGLSPGGLDEDGRGARGRVHRPRDPAERRARRSGCRC